MIFYGDLLTDRQKEFYDLYYNEDLSLSEIAENYGISRQGVRDVIVRAENYMTEIEDKTGLIKRFCSFSPTWKRSRTRLSRSSSSTSAGMRTASSKSLPA